MMATGRLPPFSIAFRDHHAPHTRGRGSMAKRPDWVILESKGFSAGMDMPRLLLAREHLKAGLFGEKLHGRVVAAGVPPGFRAAA